MLSIRGHGARLCDGISRREVMQIGTLGLTGLGLPHLLAARDATSARKAPENAGKAKSCILMFLMGGPPQHSTWDPKPEAPAEVRGEIGPLATNVPGIQFGDLMPQLAARADKLCV